MKSYYFLAIRPNGSAAVAWGESAYAALRAARRQRVDVQIVKASCRWRWPVAVIAACSKRAGSAIYEMMERCYGFVSDEDLARDTEILQRKGLL